MGRIDCTAQKTLFIGYISLCVGLPILRIFDIIQWSWWWVCTPIILAIAVIALIVLILSAKIFRVIT